MSSGQSSLSIDTDHLAITVVDQIAVRFDNALENFFLEVFGQWMIVRE